MHYHWLPCCLSLSDFDVSKTCRDRGIFYGVYVEKITDKILNHSAFKTNPKISNSDFYPDLNF